MDALHQTIKLFEQSFNEQVPTALNDYLLQLNNKISPEQTEQLANQCLSLMEKIIDNKADKTIALISLVFPFVFQLQLDPHTLQNILLVDLIQLLKQCIYIKNLEKVLHHQGNFSNKQSDQLRKMLLAMAGDTRVILFTLLYQLTTLNQAKHASEKTKQHLADLTQTIYAPLANRLGMGKIKWQLEDWAFRFKNPTEYQNIKQALNMRRADREQYVATMQQSIQDMVNKVNIKHYHCSGRAKHIYSIYKKCSRKDVGYDALYDTIALRILTDTVDECYLLLSAIHDQFTPIASEFDDYISNPKPNGYQSIHTVILGPNQHRVEIQMRTFEMHHQAEHGAYAHWIYKEGSQNNKQNYENKIAHLRQLLEWQASVQEDHLNNPDTPDSTQITNLFADRIYVFTPQGTIIDLPQGATAIDFAYMIHTDIGHRTKGALINGKLLPLSHPLQNGDAIQIQLKKEPHPSRDWLNPTLKFIKSKQAKQKISAWFKKQNQQQHLIQGQQAWEKVWRTKKLDKHYIEQIYQHFNFKDADGLLRALGAGDISVPAILQQIKALQHEETPGEQDLNTQISLTQTKKLKQRKGKNNIVIADNEGLLYQLAKCCTPIPGDDIIAYISSTRGAIIHQKQCTNVLNKLSQHPKKLLSASWNMEHNHPFEANLVIFVKDRDHLLHDITSLCAQYQTSIKQMEAINKKSGSGPNQINMTIIINSQDTYQKFINQLKQCNGVLSVNRLKQ